MGRREFGDEEQNEGGEVVWRWPGDSCEGAAEGAGGLASAEKD